jgi:hypothetical protein
VVQMVVDLRERREAAVRGPGVAAQRQ